MTNLVEIVKSRVMLHTSGTLGNVIKARNAALCAQGPPARASAKAQLQGALRQIFALAETYPNLKANQNFQQLQSELSVRTRSQRRGASSTPRRPKTMPRVKASPPRCLPNRWGSAQEFFNLDEADRRPAGEFLAQLPTRGLSGATGGTRCMGGATCGIGAT